MRTSTKATTPAALERAGYPAAVLDAHEAAAFLAVTEGTLYKLIGAGEFPHTRGGKALRFRLGDLPAYRGEWTSTHWEQVDRSGRPAKKGKVA